MKIKGPREKLQKLGAHALSDTELLAIFLRTGSPGQNVLELRSHIQFYDGIRTSDIHETIIKAAADLISRDAPDYQYLA
ncbi:UPF0758 domain-containing protein, partial [Pantoea agglomerans]|uniref:UPF0758 domain-containing protein n=1 Tax=Enterobacter agglomerans TaxID=549 RepID=UPI0030CA352B